jgi:hypothetical protein
MKERTFVAGSRCRRAQCPRLAVSRGLCGSCYQVAYQLVAAGATSWKELETKGKVSEPLRIAKQWFLN